MSQIEITQVIEQIREEIEVDELGRGKASIRATARLAGVDHTAIINHLQSGELKPTKLAERITTQGFDAGELLAWRTNGIPDIAIAIILEYYAFDAGRYCTKQAKLVCRAFNTIGVRAWMQDLKGWGKAKQTNTKPEPSQDCSKILPPSHEAAQLTLLIGEFAGLEKALTAQLAINAATTVNPALKPVADQLKSAIAQTNVASDAFLNATQIGEVVGMSAIAVNNWLVHSGLQYRTEDKKIPYRPTESGKRWGRMVPALAKGCNQTVFQLRWLPSITELFQQGQKSA
jgi:hypothetical protein